MVGAIRSRVITFLSLIPLFALPHAALAQDFQWLIGTWKLDSKQVYEVWTPGKGDDLLYGTSFRISGRDTVVTEVITIRFRNGAYQYVPDVAGDQPPIEFTMTLIDERSFVAGNPQHDFPKIIRYRFAQGRDGTPRIEASIEGDGKTIPYAFTKVK